MGLLLPFAIAVAVLLAGYGLAGPSPQKAATRRLGAVRARHREQAEEAAFRRITARTATSFEETLHRLIPNPALLRRRLERTGKSWTLGGFALVCGGLFVGVTILLLMRGLPVLLALLLGLLAGLGLPHLWVGRLTAKRSLKFTARFPDAIELMVRGLRSGLPIAETMSIVAQEVPDPVGTEFRGVVDRMKIGRTMDQALQETADRLETAEFQFFVIALAIQRETGGNLAETLSNLADVLRKRGQMKLKVKAMSSESKASAWIIGALPFVVFVLISFVNPTYMDGFFTDVRLMTIGLGGLCWMGLGVFIMSKMISFEI